MRVINNTGLVKIWDEGVSLQLRTLEQIDNTASMPFIHKHVAVMPDAHWGLGSTVGTVIPTKHAIIPAAVGVDIGCGMLAVRTSLKADQLPDNLKDLRTMIEARVPHGRTNNGGPGDRGAWGDVPAPNLEKWALLAVELRVLQDRHPRLSGANDCTHLGTLGTGNHFIELCLDEENYLWVMLHSGSRGIGNRIGSYFIAKAKEEMKRWHINLPDKDLAYLPEGSQYFNDYVAAMSWAQGYASANRKLMMYTILEGLREYFKVSHKDTFVELAAINCHHNYVQKEHHFGENVWVTRKGAVRARLGDLGIIPGSMGAKSYIVRGKGNPDSFDSCSHGAGRKMGRRDAKKLFTLEEHEKATEGVECRKDEGVLDETPGAYKDIDAVMAAQEDLVEVVHTLKQVVCVKG